VWGQDGWILAKSFLCVFMDRDGVVVHNLLTIGRGQYPAILQAWSIKELLYGFQRSFSCGTRRVVPSGQDSSILFGRVCDCNVICLPTEHQGAQRTGSNVAVHSGEGKTRIPREKPRGRVESQQQTQPTYDAGSGNPTRDTSVGGERSHHCANPAPQSQHRVRFILPAHVAGHKIIYF